ncbi:MAG: tetratricopeptide repeat protein [Nitrospinae bacterium]|nr:tetratricopeptide repeat protein [Nitrospinota bacterium]
MIKVIAKLVLLIAVLWHIPSSHAGDFAGQVARANDLYANSKFQEAAEAYESLRQQGLSSGYLYYNLGNTYIRLGKIGQAILNYTRAQKLIPRDENLQANLNFAIQQTRDKIPPPESGALATLFFWVNDLSLNENIKVAFILNLTFWITLTAWFYFRSNPFKLARNLLFSLLLLAFISVGVKLHLKSNSDMGVVLAKKVSVKSGLDSSNPTLFELHEGALVTITDKRQGWFEVQLNPKQKGWVPKDSLGT